MHNTEVMAVDMCFWWFCTFPCSPTYIDFCLLYCADVICAPSRSRRLDGLVLCDDTTPDRQGQELLLIEQAPYWQPPSPSTSTLAGDAQQADSTSSQSSSWLSGASVLGSTLSKLDILTQLLGLGPVVSGTGLRVDPNTGAASAGADPVQRNSVTGDTGSETPCGSNAGDNTSGAQLGGITSSPATRSYSWPYQPSPPSGKYEHPAPGAALTTSSG
jgi:hypothetical protein